MVLPQLEQLVRVVIGVGHFSRNQLHELEETLLGQLALKHGVEARKGKLPVLHLIRSHRVDHVVNFITKLIKLDVLVCVIHVRPQALENRIRQTLLKVILLGSIFLLDLLASRVTLIQHLLEPKFGEAVAVCEGLKVFKKFFAALDLELFAQGDLLRTLLRSRVVLRMVRFLLREGKVRNFGFFIGRHSP